MPDLREQHNYLSTTNNLLQWHLGRGFTKPKFEIRKLQLLKKAPWKALKQGPWSALESMTTLKKKKISPFCFLNRTYPQSLCIRQENFVNKFPLALLYICCCHSAYYFPEGKKCFLSSQRLCICSLLCSIPAYPFFKLQGLCLWVFYHILQNIFLALQKFLLIMHARRRNNHFSLM